MRELSYTIAPGATVNGGQRAQFVRCLSGSGTVRLRGDGFDVNMLAGRSLRLTRPVADWTIRNESAAAVAVTLLVADEGEDFSDDSLVVSSSVQGATLAVSAVSVGVAATLLAAASPGRRSIRFFNSGTVPVYLGPAGVTTATGMPIDPSSIWIEGDAAAAAFYAISGTAAQTVRVFEAL